MSAPQVSTGISIAFPSSGFTANFINVTPPQLQREALETSHMGTTGFKTYIQAKLIEGGSLSGLIQFDPALSPPIDEDPETITITFADGSTWAFSGFMTDYQPTADLETVMQATATFKVADDISFDGQSIGAT